MPKPLKARKNYDRDAEALSQLRRRVRIDTRPVDWKGGVIDKLTELIGLLNEAPPKLGS